MKEKYGLQLCWCTEYSDYGFVFFWSPCILWM